MTEEHRRRSKDDRDRVTLRPWRGDEAPTLTSICDEAEIAFRTPFPHPFSERYAQTLIDGRQGYLDLAIVNADDVPMGLASINLATQSASYVVGSRARGQGYATRALTELCRIAWTDLALDAVVLEVEPGNRASEIVAERCGFSPADSPLEHVEDKGRAYSLATWKLTL